MGTYCLLDYAVKGLDMGLQQEIWGILKCDLPAIPDPSGERDRFTHSCKGMYLPFESERPFLCDFVRACEYDFQSEIRVWPNNNKTRTRSIRQQGRAWMQHFMLPEYRKAYAAVNRLTEERGNFRLFSDPEDAARCAGEHMRLLTRIPVIEGDTIFGPYREFSPEKAWKIDGVLDYNRYLREYEETLLNRTKEGSCKAGDLIGIGFYPYDYSGREPRVYPWLVLEREGSTALLLSLYAYDRMSFTEEELGSTKTRSEIEEHLYETLYLSLFEVYPQDSRIIPFENGALMSLLSSEDAKRLDLEKKMKESVLLTPFAKERCGALSESCDWLLFAPEEERYPFCEMSGYGLHEVWPKSDAGSSYGLRPVIRINCEEAAKRCYSM